jgi:hypothetical protein
MEAKTWETWESDSGVRDLRLVELLGVFGNAGIYRSSPVLPDALPSGSSMFQVDFPKSQDLGFPRSRLGCKEIQNLHRAPKNSRLSPPGGPKMSCHNTYGIPITPLILGGLVVDLAKFWMSPEAPS